MDIVEGLKFQMNGKDSPLFSLHKKKALLLTLPAISSPSMGAVIELMFATMKAEGGVGLAAPQVGSAYSFAVIGMTVEQAGTWPERYKQELGVEPVPEVALFNPSYEPIEEKGTVSFWEGCLTNMEGYRGKVRRWVAINVTYQDSGGEEKVEILRGWKARIFQHEIDHLHGIVCSALFEEGTIVTSEEYRWYLAEGTLEVTNGA